MRFYLSLLVLVCIHCGVSLSIQFQDDDSSANVSDLGQTKVESARGFFPSNEEPSDRYSETSGIKSFEDYESFKSQNRKQLNFNGNMPSYSPPTQSFLSENLYSSVNRPLVMNSMVRGPKFPYQYVSPNSHYSSDLTGQQLYQNYANYYQHASPSYQQSQQPSSVYYDYYNPTRHPSTQTHITPMSSGANFYGHSLHQPNYYTNNYANSYGYQRPASSLYSPNIFNNIRDAANGPLGQLSTVGSQFSKALEDISINDDLQCVPKLLCQMIRNPRQPSRLPSYLNIPGITAIISALPSSSPLMNFGRAALLGLTAGECDAAYPRCPRDENQVLYYLNNHRGGFFRFFNGGSSFGGYDEDLLQSQASQQYPQQQQQPQNQGLNLLALQALADTLTGTSSGTSNSFNLNNIFTSPSSQRPAVQQQQQYYQGLQADQSVGGILSALKPSTLTDVVSNLLTGVIGNRFTRQTIMRNKRSITDEGHTIQKRIVNLKDNIIKFVDVHPQQQHKNTLFDELEKPFTFSNGNRVGANYQQQSYALKFPHDQENGSFVSSSDVLRRLKALFPDVDNFSEQFTQNLLRLMASDKGREILAGGKPVASTSNRYPQRQEYSTSSINHNYYSSNNPQFKPSKVTSGGNSKSHIVYITNGNGQIEYTVNELTGEKTRYY